jgi:hypothetical protein
MLAVWVEKDEKDEKEWVRFKNALNGLGKLKWINSERTK